MESRPLARSRSPRKQKIKLECRQDDFNDVSSLSASAILDTLPSHHGSQLSIDSEPGDRRGLRQPILASDSRLSIASVESKPWRTRGVSLKDPSRANSFSDEHRNWGRRASGPVNLGHTERDSLRVHPSPQRHRSAPKQKLVVELRGPDDILKTFPSGSDLAQVPESAGQEAVASNTGSRPPEQVQVPSLPKILSDAVLLGNLKYDKESLGGMSNYELANLFTTLTEQMTHMNMLLVTVLAERDDLHAKRNATQAHMAEILDSLNEATAKDAQAHVDKAARKANKATRSWWGRRFGDSTKTTGPKDSSNDGASTGQ